MFFRYLKFMCIYLISLYRNIFSNCERNYEFFYAKFTHPGPENILCILKLYVTY